MSHAARMFTRVAAFGLLLISLTGCSSTSIGTAHLASYANLYAQGPTTLVYMQSEVSDYNAFLVEPIHYRVDSRTKIRPRQIRQLATELQKTIDADLTSAGYSLVNKPQPGIIRIRLILAQLGSGSSVFAQANNNATKDLKTGQAVLEAELLSLDGKTQLGAVVIADAKHPVTLKDLLNEKTAGDIYKQWALQLRLRIDEMHGRSTM